MSGTAQSRAWLVAGGLATVIAMQAGRTAAEEPQGSQLTLPSQVTATASEREQANRLLGQTHRALQSNNLPQAVQSFRQLTAVSANDVRLRLHLLSLRQGLLQQGVPAAELPPVAEVTPAERKQETLRLVALGRAALDRGDVPAAVAITRQAKSLGVPRQAFAANEPQLWPLELDVNAAARRAGIPPVDHGVVQAGGAPTEGAPEAPTGVQQAGYDQAPSSGAGDQAVMPAQATGPTTLTPPPAGASPVDNSEGARLYREGVEALSAGDRSQAQQLFREAWQFEAELDPGMRRQLQGKLQLMQQPAATEAGQAGRPLSPLEQVDAKKMQARQRLYREVTNELGLAYNDRIEAPLDALDRIVKLRRRVADSAVDKPAQQQLLAMVERAIKEQQKYVDENRADIELDVRNEQVRTDLETERRRKLETDDEIAEKVDEYNQLIRDRRYSEALVIAKQVGELAPGSEIARQMFQESQNQTRRLQLEEITAEQRDMFVDHLNDVQRSNRAPAPGTPLEFMDAETWGPLSEARLARLEAEGQGSPAEQEIKRRLLTPVDVRFRNQPLGEVLKTLEMVTGVPMYIDQKALAAARVQIDTPVTLDLSKQISLQSALQLMLGQYDLTYTVGNEVLNVTSNEVKRSQVAPRTYKVSDLVTPIPNFSTSYDDGLAGALKAAYQMNTETTNVSVAPMSPVGLASAQEPVNNPNVLAQYQGFGQSPGSRGGQGMMPGARGGGAIADFDTLMQLIQTTVAPDTWEALGGPSSMAPYPQNLSLVISTTSEVHDQISELLESLRRLQNLQVTIEVRFITLSDSFFEQIGVDFDVAFDDKAPGLPDDDSGNSVVVGLSNNNRQFTPDFDFRLENNNFNVSPIFGGVDPGALSTFGFAILSDIEAFFFLQAAQGDNRTNVMQAPKVTLFDGQSASIQDQSQRPFVTSIRPVVGDFAVAQQPVIVVLNEGTELNVQAVVSDDKRFVRLTLVPFFSQIGDVDEFTFTGRSTSTSSSRDDIDPETGEPTDTDESRDVTEGTTVQLPTFAFTTVNTTVSVPDGGTILLGGIKRLREGRAERGIPILSKLPYISRLFRNTAIGRDASSLMLMVTPRIIIQEEEEIAQTGFDPRR